MAPSGPVSSSSICWLAMHWRQTWSPLLAPRPGASSPHRVQMAEVAQLQPLHRSGESSSARRLMIFMRPHPPQSRRGRWKRT